MTERKWRQRRLTAPEVLEQSDYLPYGTRIQNPDHLSGLDNRWRYAAKEAQRFGPTDAFSPSIPTAFGGAGSLDLSLLDFGARMYDPFVARWTTVDPFSSKYMNRTPFNYCHGDPINLFDPNGLSTYVVQLSDGSYRVVGGNIYDNDRSIYLCTYDKKGNIERGAIIGKSVTLYSFYDTDNKKWDTNIKSMISNTQIMTLRTQGKRMHVPIQIVESLLDKTAQEPLFLPRRGMSGTLELG